MVYNVTCIISSWQGTLGKKLLGLRVVNAIDLHKLSIGTAFLRTFFLYAPGYLYFLPIDPSGGLPNQTMLVITGLIYIITFMVFLFNSKNIFLHDLISKSVVVKI